MVQKAGRISQISVYIYINVYTAFYISIYLVGTFWHKASTPGQKSSGSKQVKAKMLLAYQPPIPNNPVEYMAPHVEAHRTLMSSVQSSSPVQVGPVGKVRSIMETKHKRRET